MPKYLVTENIVVLDENILNQGDEIEIIDGNYTTETKFGTITLSYESIKNSVKQKEEIKIQVNLLDDEEVIKDYRIQLDIKVSRKKAREIENYLRETLERMI
jgi:hypothetical protein